jgi:pyruvate-ferredoxin/flavodoxin oxidoreductase
MNMRYSQVEAKKAVDAGYWPLYRYNPALEEGKKFTWDIKKAPTVAYQDFLKGEVRYTSLYKTNPEHADELFAKAEADAKRRMTFYEQIGEIM